MSILVTGCGRSGTLYIATVLRALGIATSHEQVFTPDRREPPVTMREFEASSSWLAAPFVGVLPEDRIVFHQVRDPRLVIASLLGIRFFRPWRPRPLSAATGDLVESTRRALLRRHDRPIRADYVRFVAWADPQILIGDELSRCIAYWIRWNRMIEERAPATRYVRYRLEDVDGPFVASMLERAGIERALSDVDRAIATVSPRMNARERDRYAAERIRAHPRYEELVHAADRYGYRLDG